MSLLDDLQWLIDAAAQGDTGEFTGSNLLAIKNEVELLLADLAAAAVLMREFADKVESEWGPGALTDDEWGLIKRLERAAQG